MASLGPRDPSLDDSGWTNLSNAYHDGGGYGYVAGDNVDGILYGFDFSSLPSSCTINGITVELDAYKDETAGSGTLQIGAELTYNSGTNWTSTSKKTGNLTTSEAKYTLGGATDTWGRTWTRAEVQSTVFRVRVKSKNTILVDSPQWRIDWLRVTIAYTDTSGLSYVAEESVSLADAAGPSMLVWVGSEAVSVTESGWSPSASSGYYGGSVIDELESDPADFTSATTPRNATVALAMLLVLNTPTGSVVCYFGDAILAEENPGMPIQPCAIDFGDITMEGAPATDPRLSEAVVRIVSKVVAPLVGTTAHIATLLRSSYVLGSSAKVYAWAKEGSSWFSSLLFSGVVQRIALDDEVVEFRLQDTNSDLMEIPTITLGAASMTYGGNEGTLPESYLDAPVPIAFGRFDPSARDDWSGFLGSSKSEAAIVAAMLGYRFPMVPLLPVSQEWKYGVGGLTTYSKTILLAFGDKRTVAPVIELRHERTSGNNVYDDYLGYIGLHHQGTDPDFLYPASIFSWNSELARAMPFVWDLSTDIPGARTVNNGACESRARSTAITTLSPMASAQGFYIARLDPAASGNDQIGLGVLQAVALTPTMLTGVKVPTGGAAYGCQGLTDDEALKAIDGKLDTYATVPVGGRLSIQLPSDGPGLGAVHALRVGILCDAGSTATGADIYGRFTWEIPDNAISAEFETLTSGTSPKKVYLDFTSSAGVATFYLQNRRFWTYVFNADGNGVDQWDFTKKGHAYGAAGPSDPKFSMAYDLVINPTGTAGQNLRIVAVWLEPIFRPRIDEYTRRPEEGETKYEGESKSFQHGGASVDWSYTYRRTLVPYGGNIPVPEVKDLGRLALYGTGRSCYDNTNGDYTGVSGALIEKPTDIALAVIERYRMEKSICAAGTTFGSFAQARTVLASRITPNAWRLSPYLKDRVTLRKFLALLSEQACSYCMRQPAANAQGYEYRWFVDGPAPHTDSAARLYRGDGGLFDLETEIVEGSFSIQPYSIENLASSFLLRYGYHEPSQTFTSEMQVSKSSDNLVSGGTLYRAALGETESRYGISRQQVIEAPWVWSAHVADKLIKWRANIAREPRLAIEFAIGPSGLDIRPGHVIRFSDTVGNRVPYPGRLGSSAWSSHNFVVTSVSFAEEASSSPLARVVAVETYTEPS